jgi:hypothetical protein
VRNTSSPTIARTEIKILATLAFFIYGKFRHRPLRERL